MRDPGIALRGLLVAAFPPGNEENPYENPTSSPQVAAMSATLIGLAERTLGRLAPADLAELERIVLAWRDAARADAAHAEAAE